MKNKATIQLLRFKFSFFLLPVYLFALVFTPVINWHNAILIFILLHLFLYPASNGYNSYMDRDQHSIGGIEHPPLPTPLLYYLTIALDISGVLISFCISSFFAAMYILYIILSKLYSYRAIRLKQYAFIGYAIVILSQGALIFYMVFYGADLPLHPVCPLSGLMISTILIGAFYPLTQIYQHNQDVKDNVITLSYKLGIRGTFIYCGVLYLVAFSLLACYFVSIHHLAYFFILQAFFLPVIIKFVTWAGAVWKDKGAANYKNTMQMNWSAATYTNLAFTSLLILRHTI